MSSRNALYGDAKAGAREVDGQRKQKALIAAQEKYAASATSVNRLALASALFDLGRFAEAEIHMKELLAAEGGNPDVLFELGFIYKNLNRKDEAIAIWKQLVEANPRHHLSRGAENEIWRLDSTYKPSWIK
jgi:tetratricopeptide (TPR) repeat protein